MPTENLTDELPPTGAGDRASAEKAVARRFLDLVGTADIEALTELITADWTMIGGPPALPPGRAGLETLFASFGEITQTWQIEQILAEGDLLAVRAINHCTMESFLGVPGRGVEQIFAATFVHQLVGGRIARTWRTADDLGRLLQLGVRIEAGAR